MTRGGSKARASPTVATLQRDLAALARRVDALTASRGTAPPSPPSGTSDLELAETLARRKSNGVAYGGALEISGRSYLWQIERPAASLLALDPASYAHVLAALGHPHRWRLLVGLLEQPRSASQLQETIGASSSGPLYHHLRELVALGIVAQREDRTYEIPARHAVPLVTAIALAIDLGARAGQRLPDEPPPVVRSRKRR